jgi:hypothetical protein
MAEAKKSNIAGKMIRAAKLDMALYREVEVDKGATGQAFLVVLIVSIAAGIGMGLMVLGEGGMWFLWGLLVGLLTSIAGWLVWAFIAFFLGITIFRGSKTRTTCGEFLRTFGFAQSPGMLKIFAFIPIIGWWIILATWLWSLWAGVIAAREALDFSTARAVGTVVVGWVIALVVVVITFLLILIY